jgi:acetyl-CoA carboxylase carboxyltransferase component
VAPDDVAAAGLARELLGYLPAQLGERTPRAPSRPPLAGDPGDCVPREHRRAYDVRSVIERVVDDGELLEVAPGWARNLVCGFARIDGRSVGIVANQPRWLGGVLDAESSQKGARFVSQCDKFGIPLVVLVDTPGYMPGTRQESAGVIRFGATLVHAFAEASVPRVTVVLRKAFGGAYITMNSKDLGADYVFAWPEAEMGVMAAASAVGLIHRRELAAADDPQALRSHLQARYEEDHLQSASAARTGYVDELIQSYETRERLAWALESLAGGR